MTRRPPAILMTASESPKNISTYEPATIATSSSTHELRAMRAASVARIASDAPRVIDRKIGATPGGLMIGSSVASANMTAPTKPTSMSTMARHHSYSPAAAHPGVDSAAVAGQPPLCQVAEPGRPTWSRTGASCGRRSPSIRSGGWRRARRRCLHGSTRRTESDRASAGLPETSWCRRRRPAGRWNRAGRWRPGGARSPRRPRRASSGARSRSGIPL